MEVDGPDAVSMHRGGGAPRAPPTPRFMLETETVLPPAFPWSWRGTQT